MAIDILALWDFSDLPLSEQRFRDALVGSSEDDQLILQTQIARTYGIRKNFEQARAILDSVADQLNDSGPEARVRYHLELGRTYSSTTHSSESQNAEAKEAARTHYMASFELAKDAGLDYLAVDALHMMTMVDTSPEAQIEWNSKAIAFMEASQDPAAKLWEASLRNNLGYALHLQERYEDALNEFNTALELRKKTGKEPQIRVAYWMIAWTFRAMNRLDEALEIQLRLEQECDDAGRPDTYVYKELEQIFLAKNDPERAEIYRLKQAPTS